MGKWAFSRFVTIVFGLFLIGSIGLAQQSSFSMPMTVDFDDWTEETFPPIPNNIGQATWTVQPDDTMIIQTDNGQPTFYYSDFTSFNKQITISMSVDGSATTDDDFIGFAIGFTPGDATLVGGGPDVGSPTNPGADYLILDWKKATQVPVDFGPDGNGGTGLVGMALSRVSGFPSANELYQHTDYPDITPSFVGSVTEIARATNLGSTGWAYDTTYDFVITYTADRMQIRVNGVLEFDEFGSFPNINVANANLCIATALF